MTVLSPLRQKTATGVNALNEALQRKLNPSRKGCKEVVIGLGRSNLNNRIQKARGTDKLLNGSGGMLLFVGTGCGTDTDYLIEL